MEKWPQNIDYDFISQRTGLQNWFQYSKVLFSIDTWTDKHYTDPVSL